MLLLVSFINSPLRVFLGEAIFASEPRVNVLNDVNIQAISANTWFLNENTHVSGNLTFEQVDFTSHVDLRVRWNAMMFDEVQ